MDMVQEIRKIDLGRYGKRRRKKAKALDLCLFGF
jgi:hypothetical protein